MVVAEADGFGDAVPPGDIEVQPEASEGAPPLFQRDIAMDADFIIRSSDLIQFWVAKTVLSLASPVFRNMFATLVLPAQDTHPDDYVEGTPVVSVTEDSRVLNQLLRFCYPVENPALTTLDEIVALLHAGRKYEISMLQAQCTPLLREFSRNEPMRVYAIAAMFEMEDLARFAAQQSLFFPLASVLAARFPEAQFLTHACFQRLCAYREKCASILPEAVEIATLRHQASASSWIRKNKPFSCCRNIEETVRHTRVCVVKWWFDYVATIRASLSTLNHEGMERHVGEKAMDEALARAYKCSACQVLAIKNLRLFTEELSMTLNKMARKVSTAAYRLCSLATYGDFLPVFDGFLTNAYLQVATEHIFVNN